MNTKKLTNGESVPPEGDIAATAAYVAPKKQNNRSNKYKGSDPIGIYIFEAAVVLKQLYSSSIISINNE